MRRFATYFFFFSLLLLGAGYGLKSYPLLKVSYVQVVGSDKLTAADLPVSVGQNLLAVDFEAVVSAAMKHQYIASAAAKADHYGKVTVAVTEKVPVSYIYIDDLYGLTHRGELIPSNLNDSGRHLPIVRGIKLERPYPFSQTDHADLRAVIEVIQSMQAQKPKLFEALSEVVAADGELKLIFEPGSIVVNLGWGHTEDKLARLEEILMTNKNPGIDIDLRLADIAVMKSRMTNREVNHGI